MPLSNSHIIRIRNIGFSENFFIVKRNGNQQLRNSAGRCVFHNGERCTIYNDRPEGCRLYPIIFDLYMGESVSDAHCPHHEEFQFTPSISCEVIRLVRKLDLERRRRLRSWNHSKHEWWKFWNNPWGKVIVCIGWWGRLNWAFPRAVELRPHFVDNWLAEKSFRTTVLINNLLHWALRPLPHPVFLHLHTFWFWRKSTKILLS